MKKLILITGILGLLGCSPGNYYKSSPYHLKAFPELPKYSTEFYQVIPREDQELMSQREWRIQEWKLDAQKLEKLHNTK